MKLEDYSKYYIQGSDHYLIPKDEFIELFNKKDNWKEETIELKKQNSNFKTALDESQEIIVDYIKENQELKKQLEVGEEQYNDLVEENEILTKKISNALKKIEEYNLIKYDYSIPTIGIIELKEILKRSDKE